SGLTHTWAEPWKEDNEFRIGELVIQKNFGIIQIDWKGSEPTIEMRVMGLRQQVFNKVSFSF
ncbi:MAG: alkaline phosphatase family protein, partial [Cytophagales bacterium]